MSRPTKDPEEEQEPGELASPACYAHEVDPAYMGLAPDEKAEATHTVTDQSKKHPTPK